MLRIQRDESVVGRTTIRLEGRLGSADLELLLANVEPCLVPGHDVEFDLAELRFLDDRGSRLLSQLSERGVRLTGATGYVRELLSAVENES